MKFSMAIMAHPKREQWVPGLLAEMPGAVTVWDERNDRWDTGRRSLLAYDPSADFHVVVQDDAIVPSGFVDIVKDALNGLRFDGPVGFYFGKSRPRALQTSSLMNAAKRRGACWIRFPGPWWGVGIAVPTADIPAVVDYGDHRTDVANYDLKIARYYQSIGQMCNYTMPSVVDHRTADNPSLVAGRTGGNRRAYWYIGDEPEAIDWSGPAVNAEGKPA